MDPASPPADPAGGTAALLLAPLLAFVIGWLVFPVPDVDEAVNNQVALISYSDGSELTRLVPEAGNRTKVQLAQIPVPVRHAVLAAEDRSFYSNPGFDLTGILRAVWNQLRGGDGGGSTITQQYVKNALVGNDISLWRKYRELIVSVKLVQQRSKDDILTDYLNTIYFGRGAYGIEAAAQAYFGKHVTDLGAAEGALLAGVIQGPSRWDPALDLEKATQRWEFVMDGMASQGWLSAAERSSSRFPATQPRRLPSSGSFGDERGHIIDSVKSELESLGITDREVAQDGLRITTTIDRGQQGAAVAAVRRAFAGQPDELRAAVVTVDAATGGIRAYYGGDDGVGLDYAQVRKQAGSTFKPFAVLASLLHEPPAPIGQVYDGTEPSGRPGADGADCPRCDVTRAMTISNNAVFLKLALRLGPEQVAAAARAAGITSPLDHPDERLALGNKEVTPLELASAYATLADGGVWHAPHVVARVVDGDGRLLYDAGADGASAGDRRFGEQVARNVAETMLDVAAYRGLGTGTPVAAAPGTVPSRIAGETNDAWFGGFTPAMATAVWIGTDRNSPLRTSSATSITGSTLPGRVWRDVMATAPQLPFGPFRPIGEPAPDLPSGTPTRRQPTEGP
ncbi:transglycosylase domain-containing protein [Pseudonocardia xinjiangensis]|uniref:transglycosylase domain-containing protein n=1 Tax=Pseudonocardia xinjiangensis TaxID=75289 RepID=UPI003D8D2263